jgi:hypothetical protein
VNSEVSQVFHFRIHRSENSIGISNPTRSLQGDELRLDHLLANHFVDRQENEEDGCE